MIWWIDLFYQHFCNQNLIKKVAFGMYENYTIFKIPLLSFSNDLIYNKLLIKFPLFLISETAAASAEIYRPDLSSSQMMPSLSLQHCISRPPGSNEEFKCEKCGKCYSTHMGLYYHKQTHNPPKYACPACDKPFHRTFSLKQHLAKIHQLVQCFHCYETFSVGHQKTHVCRT